MSVVTIECERAVADRRAVRPRTSVPADLHLRSPGCAPLRLTRRGRALLLAVALVLALLVGGAAVAATDDGPPPRSDLPTVVVQEGDTLWRIAAQHAPDRDPVATMIEIRRLNGLRGSKIEVGQELVLPAP